MLRLAHRILTQELVTISGSLPAIVGKEQRDRIRGGVAASFSVIADEIAEMYLQDEKQEWDTDNFHCVAPVADNFLIEWRLPPVESWNINGPSFCKQYPQLAPRAAGVLIQSVLATEFSTGKRSGPITIAIQEALARFPSTHWVMFCNEAFSMPNGNALIMPWLKPVFVRADGRLLHWGGLGAVPLNHRGDVDTGLMNEVFLTLSFMHCKNVVKRDATNFEGPSLKWIRRQKAPTIRYHILDINPMKEVLRTEGGIEHNGLKKAMHICRGHFVTYTEEKPLFGRIVGTFWKSAHVRGSAEHGIVNKDYRVKANA